MAEWQANRKKERKKEKETKLIKTQMKWKCESKQIEKARQKKGKNKKCNIKAIRDGPSVSERNMNSVCN